MQERLPAQGKACGARQPDDLLAHTRHDRPRSLRLVVVNMTSPFVYDVFNRNFRVFIS